MKKNIFAETYTQVQELKKQYNAAKTAEDEAGMIGALRENGVSHFTFSSGWSGAVDTAWLFTQNG